MTMTVQDLRGIKELFPIGIETLALNAHRCDISAAFDDFARRDFAKF